MSQEMATLHIDIQTTTIASNSNTDQVVNQNTDQNTNQNIDCCCVCLGDEQLTDSVDLYNFCSVCVIKSHKECINKIIDNGKKMTGCPGCRKSLSIVTKNGAIYVNDIFVSKSIPSDDVLISVPVYVQAPARNINRRECKHICWGLCALLVMLLFFAILVTIGIAVWKGNSSKK